jgi:hypothetical protein
MLSFARQLALFTESETQALIYMVIGIIIIEGIWLAYISFVMWKRYKEDKRLEAIKKEEPKKIETEKEE